MGAPTRRARLVFCPPHEHGRHAFAVTHLHDCFSIHEKTGSLQGAAHSCRDYLRPARASVRKAKYRHVRFGAGDAWMI